MFTTLLRVLPCALAVIASADEAPWIRFGSYRVPPDPVRLGDLYAWDLLPVPPGPPPDPPAPIDERYVVPFVPVFRAEPTFMDRLQLEPIRYVTIRPTGVPWFLPGELGTDKSGDKPGPGAGLSATWRPSSKWVFGFDLIMRADRVSFDNRFYDWTPYVIPGVDYTPFPNSPRPFSIGISTPRAIYRQGDNRRDQPWGGYFMFIRWVEVMNALPTL